MTTIQIALIVYLFINANIAGGFLLEDFEHRATSIKGIGGWMILLVVGFPMAVSAYLQSVVQHKLSKVEWYREAAFRFDLWSGKFKNASPGHIRQLEQYFGDDSSANEMAKRHWRIIKQKYGYNPVMTRPERRQKQRKARKKGQR